MTNTQTIIHLLEQVKSQRRVRHDSACNRVKAAADSGINGFTTFLVRRPRKPLPHPIGVVFLLRFIGCVLAIGRYNIKCKKVKNVIERMFRCTVDFKPSRDL